MQILTNVSKAELDYLTNQPSAKAMIEKNKSEAVNIAKGDVLGAEEFVASRKKENNGVDVKGKTIGQPKLSEKAAKYYEELKSKYKNMDFILVSKDMKEMAKANAGSFANPQKMVVLIDEEKIERMAEDEKFRKQYEGVIASAQNQLPQLKQALGRFSNVKGFGVQVKDNGVTSFFAVMNKSFNDQTARLEKRRVEKKAEKKEAEKKAEKKERQERLLEKREEHRLEAKEAEKVLSADSMEELLKMVEDFNYQFVSDTTMTEAEKGLGTVIDFKG